MTVPPVLQIDGLSKRYGAFWALADATFAIRPGEVLGLIGPNGSGKTTLFECLAGVIPATLGAVSANGRALPPDARKNVLFYMPDRVRPWPDQTVGWVLSFIAGLYGSGDDRSAQVVHELALESLVDARMHDLSKGEHKRVLVALGLLTSPRVLMLDEPFDGLDLRQTREVMTVLRSHAGGEQATASGRTLFLSIHQLGDAARICDRLVLLSGGRIVGQGTLDELRAAAGVAEGGLEEVFLALT